MHTSAYVSIRKHTSAYASICQHTCAAFMRTCPLVAGRQRPVPPDTDAASGTLLRSIALSVIDNNLQQRSICQHPSGYVRIRQHTPACAAENCGFFSEIDNILQQRTFVAGKAYVSIRRHTSAYVSIPAAAHVCRRKAKRPANSRHRHGLVPLCRVRAWDERHLRRVSVSICTFVPVKQVNL
jgi:hypothetical protein